MDPLHLSLQTIEELLTGTYWTSVCPFLTIKVEGQGSSFTPPPPPPIRPVDDSNCNYDGGRADAVLRQTALNNKGFFRIAADATGVDPLTLSKLERGIHRLVSLGHAPSAITLYDEAWELGADLSHMLTSGTGNTPSGDTVAFLVAPGRHIFSGPHRDKPRASSGSFREDGAPMFVTAWVALSAAPSTASCLYFLPADKDPGYHANDGGADGGVGVDAVYEALQGVDAVYEALPGPLSWPKIQAQPCAAGDVLCFSHRLLHWGGEADEGAPPRVALSYSFADPSFEQAAFSASLLPLPPLAVRLALVAGQAILYNAQSPLSKHDLALNNRIFAQQQKQFESIYSEKVLSAAQNLKFIMSRGR